MPLLLFSGNQRNANQGCVRDAASEPARLLPGYGRKLQIRQDVCGPVHKAVSNLLQAGEPVCLPSSSESAAVEAGGWKDHTAAPAMRPVERDGGKAGETFSALGTREAQMNENN